MNGEDRIKRDLAKQISRARSEAGLTQHELALRLGPTITAQQVSRWERGTAAPSFGSLAALGRTLGHPTSWFFEGD